LYSIVGVGLRITTQTGVIGYIQNMVSTGAISVELLKPICLQLRVLFRDVGIILRRLLFVFFIIFVISSLIFRTKLNDITIQNIRQLDILQSKLNEMIESVKVGVNIEKTLSSLGLNMEELVKLQNGDKEIIEKFQKNIIEQSKKSKRGRPKKVK
jgi:ABC-type uncharacterized transport system permease subunit